MPRAHPRPREGRLIALRASGLHAVALAVEPLTTAGIFGAAIKLAPDTPTGRWFAEGTSLWSRPAYEQATPPQEKQLRRSRPQTQLASEDAFDTGD